jgi:catalase (peroxidase I)
MCSVTLLPRCACSHRVHSVSPLGQSVDAATGRLMMLPSDLVLLQDKSFLKWVQTYAKDDAKFDADFTKAFQKLEELGTSNLTPTEWA